MIVVAGKDRIAIEVLELAMKFAKPNEIRVVLNADEGKVYWRPSLLNFVNRHGIGVLTLEEVYKQGCDLFISAEFDRIIKLRNIKRAYNIHFSELPRGRGVYTSIWPIINGYSHSAVTIHEIDTGIDTGEIKAQRIFDISDRESSWDLYNKYMNNAIELLRENFSRIIANDWKDYTPDKDVAPSFYSRNSIDLSDLEIPITKDVEKIDRYIRSRLFRVYQLPVYKGCSVTSVLQNISSSNLYSNNGVIKVNLNDVSYFLFKDNSEYIIKNCGKMSVSEFEVSQYNMMSINDHNQLGWTPLIVASYHGNIELVKYLISQGADIDRSNFKGTTPLMYAKNLFLTSGDDRTIRALLSAGSNVYKRDWSGKSLFDYLSDNDYKKMEKYF